ncbi:hypothetical protein JIN85_14180 [Luteolibacter pohnpeiensis]|uniref:Low-complexity protein n=1 Tax=Luteolibacter pohnpeiensis TaxID=454153 RepID=A0A934VX83_9BACT|nr:hypothetical protein [Luteolibacter pohnpeiensis]MBK1883568.1 hypothetical protein [Luteolibacter pohnpeiensis]
MKLNQSLMAAAVAGIVAAGTATAQPQSTGAHKEIASKDGCKSKEGCDSKEKKKETEKESCSTKEGCSTKEKKGQSIL